MIQLALKKMYKESGVLGILDWIYDKKRFAWATVILKCIFFIFPYEDILRKTHDFNTNIKQCGFSDAAKKYLKDLKINVHTNTDNLPSGPCIIFGNHPTGLDPYIITSVLQRDDVYIVADIYHKKKGTEIGKHIIPISYAPDINNFKGRGFINSIGFIVMRLLTGYERKSSVKEKNKIAIEEAVQKAINGNAVMIFPDGGSNNPEFWYSGIGEIIKNSLRINQKIALYSVYTENISSRKLVQHFLFNRKRVCTDQKIELTIQGPLMLNELQPMQNKRAEEITEYLRDRFIKESIQPSYIYAK